MVVCWFLSDHMSVWMSDFASNVCFVLVFSVGVCDHCACFVVVMMNRRLAPL